MKQPSSPPPRARRQDAFSQSGVDPYWSAPTPAVSSTTPARYYDYSSPRLHAAYWGPAAKPSQSPHESPGFKNSFDMMDNRDPRFTSAAIRSMNPQVRPRSFRQPNLESTNLDSTARFGKYGFPAADPFYEIDQRVPVVPFLYSAPSEPAADIRDMSFAKRFNDAVLNRLSGGSRDEVASVIRGESSGRALSPNGFNRFDNISETRGTSPSGRLNTFNYVPKTREGTSIPPFLRDSSSTSRFNFLDPGHDDGMPHVSRQVSRDLRSPNCFNAYGHPASRHDAAITSSRGSASPRYFNPFDLVPPGRSGILQSFPESSFNFLDDRAMVWNGRTASRNGMTPSPFQCRLNGLRREAASANLSPRSGISSRMSSPSRSKPLNFLRDDMIDDFLRAIGRAEAPNDVFFASGEGARESSVLNGDLVCGIPLNLPKFSADTIQEAKAKASVDAYLSYKHFDPNDWCGPGDCMPSQNLPSQNMSSPGRTEFFRDPKKSSPSFSKTMMNMPMESKETVPSSYQNGLEAANLMSSTSRIEFLLDQLDQGKSSPSFATMNAPMQSKELFQSSYQNGLDSTNPMSSPGRTEFFRDPKKSSPSFSTTMMNEPEQSKEIVPSPNQNTLDVANPMSAPGSFQASSNPMMQSRPQSSSQPSSFGGLRQDPSTQKDNPLELPKMSVSRTEPQDLLTGQPLHTNGSQSDASVANEPISRSPERKDNPLELPKMSVSRTEPQDSASRLFVSGQITASAWKACSTWISNMPAEADIQTSACPFNLPNLPETTATFPRGIVKLNVPCFGGILDAVMELFYITDVWLCANQMKIRIPEYKIDTFIKGKMKIVRDMTCVARARNDCIGQNLEAVARLESFANDFEGINEKSIRNLDDWKTFVSKHVSSGWEEKLAFEHVLGNFGFDEAFATSLRNSEVGVIDPKTGAKEESTWQHRGVRWVSKALGGYKPVGCLTDVVNLIFAMMGYKPADVALGLSEARVIGVIKDFKRCIENGDLRKLWIPNYVMLDCESDDMLVWCLLTCVHEKRGTSLSVLAQLPEHEDAEPIANYLRKSLGCEVFRDSDSQNLEAILHYWNEMLDQRDAPHPDSEDELLEEPKESNSGRRFAFSSEVYGVFNQRKPFSAPKCTQTNEQYQFLLHSLRECVFFASLGLEVIEAVAAAMEIEKEEDGACILRQGDHGRSAYILIEGLLDIFDEPVKAGPSSLTNSGATPTNASRPPPLDSIGSSETRGTFIRNMEPGRFFGEMTMLWGVPRSKSVYANGSCTLGKLKRDAYMNLVVQRAVSQRSLREDTLRKVKMFETLNEEQVSSLADALEKRQFEKDEAIVKQGDEGHEFFVVLCGECVIEVATGTDLDNLDVQEHGRYEQGDLFGELALQNNAKRSATIRAVTFVEVLCLSREKFERMLGTLDNLQHTNYLNDPRKCIADFFAPGGQMGPRGMGRLLQVEAQEQWEAGDKVRVVKESRLKGATAEIISTDWNGMVKVSMDEDDAKGRIKSFKFTDIEPIDNHQDGEQTSWFAVYRPTSRDAIAKMLSGSAVGKGLNVKGKSAKKNRLSGFVPFLQISRNEDKTEIEESPADARLAIYYTSEGARQTALLELEKVMKEQPEISILDHRILPLDGYKGVWGLDLPEPLMREVYIMQPDISELMGWETGRKSEPAFMDMNLHAVRGDSEPKVVLYQHDSDNVMNPRGLLIAYAEEMVKPVVSDFDTFTIGSRGMNYATLPPEQQSLANWSLDRTREILESASSTSWTSLWLEVIRSAHEQNFHPDVPKYGFGDATSVLLTEGVCKSTIDSGAVRHGAECFNFFFPQELDEDYLVVWEGFPDKPWDYKSEEDLRAFLRERIKQGYCFPLNPVWTVRDAGWYDILRELRASESAVGPLNSWFPAESGLLTKIESIHSSFPQGLLHSGAGQTDRSRLNSLAGLDLEGCERAELAYFQASKKAQEHANSFISLMNKKRGGLDQNMSSKKNMWQQRTLKVLQEVKKAELPDSTSAKAILRAATNHDLANGLDDNEDDDLPATPPPEEVDVEEPRQCDRRTGRVTGDYEQHLMMNIADEQYLEVGDIVKVDTEIKYADDKNTLEQDMQGKIEKINQAGDVFVHFQVLGSKIWIQKSDSKMLSQVDDSMF